MNFPGCRGSINIGRTVDDGWDQIDSDGQPVPAQVFAPMTQATVATLIAPARPEPAMRPAPASAASTSGSSTAGRAGVDVSGVTATATRAARSAASAGAQVAVAAMDAARPMVTRTASRMVELGLEVLNPSEAPVLSGGRDVAGASAQAEFDRRKARHRQKMRSALPAVVGVTLIAMLLAFLALGRFGGLVSILGSVVVGIAGLLTMASLPPDALSWRAGAMGQRRTAEHLDELAAVGYVVLHDRVVPGIRANVSHIAIGPGGVFAIETKNLRGRLSIVGDKLFVGERTRTGIVDETLRGAMGVQVVLSERLNALRMTVRPILCVHGTPQLLLDNDVQGVRVVSGGQLIRYLRRQAALLDADTVQELAAILDRRLAPALP